MMLASPAEDGIYKGFMGVNGWENWWLREANNVIWGNLGEEGKTFYASSEDSHWNFWFPNPSGCYYTTVNTVEGWWSALHVASLSVSGDVTGEMAYNKQSNQWTLPVNLATQSTLTISVSGKGSLYNRETTDIGPAIEQTVAFGGNSQNLLFGESADNISVTMPAGENLLVLDLSNPLQFTIGIGEDVPQPEVSQYLYFSGITNWEGFDDYLTLYDEAGLCYGGAHWIDSEWGYRAYTEQAWEPAYNAADGSTDLSGTLILAESKDNIPAPAQGLYVMDFNMKSLTYELTQVQTVTFTGLNDNWSESPMTQSAENPEIFTAEFIKEKKSPWGVKVLINNNWNLFFGGGSGILHLKHSESSAGFDGDDELEIGKTYVLTVDLGHQTYFYSLK